MRYQAKSIHYKLQNKHTTIGVQVAILLLLPHIQTRLDTSLLVLGSGVGDQVADTAGVAPLVVVPGDELDEGVAQLDTSLSVEDGGGGVADEVSGDESVLGVLEDTLVLALGGGLDGSLDFVVLGGLLEADDEIDNGDVEGGDTEGHTTLENR
jgi:hypothetical protein